MKIEMCLLRHEEAVRRHIPLTQIASHPSALQQIEHWKQAHPVAEIPVPEGTSEAARRLSSGELEVGIGVIGPKLLADLYPHLVLVEQGIQDTKDNILSSGFLKSKRGRNR